MQRLKFPSAQQLAVFRNASNLALTLKASPIILGVAAMYSQDLSIIFSDALNNEPISRILVVPLLFAYLIRRSIRREKSLQYRRLVKIITIDRFLLASQPRSHLGKARAAVYTIFLDVSHITHF